MRIGINTFLFTFPFTNQSIEWFPKFKQWGFDSVEIAIDNPDVLDVKMIKSELDKNGLVCGSVCGVFGPGLDLRGSKEDQQASVDYVQKVIALMPALGCSVFAGPMYSSVGRAGAEAPEDYLKQWNTVVGHLKTLAKVAEKAGVVLAIEPLNRFETDFINTVDQALKMVKDVGSKAIKIHLDTFHMNIEEKNQAAAIRRAGSSLGHFHACGSDRGTPGNDAIDWVGIKLALKEINYRGDLVIESFTQDVKAIARAAAIWRNMELSNTEIAIKGQLFLRKAFGG
jgi:D-psicose/D-tagatose/L-ribulose 3-epimerase